MARQTATDGGSDTIDLTDEMPVVSFDIRSNNETVRYYPEAGDAEFGVITHTYEGLPARGVVRYDVTGYEIVDMDFEPERPDTTMKEEFEAFETEIREWIEDALFTTGVGSSDAHIERESSNGHTVVVVNPYEGDRYTIELATENKRRTA